MVKLEKAVIARFEQFGSRFEILVDPDLAMKLKKGDSVNFNDLLALDTIFKDAGKGTEQSPDALNKVFGTTDTAKIAKKIIEQGDIQLTTEQRRELRDRKRLEIIEYISRNAMNPQTNAPHPPKRIENALDEIKFHVDEHKSVEEQIPEIVKKIKVILPISFENLQIAVKIPAVHAARVDAALHKYRLLKEEWQSNGSLIAIVEMPAGVKADFLNELNHLTHGDIESKIMERK